MKEESFLEDSSPSKIKRKDEIKNNLNIISKLFSNYFILFYLGFKKEFLGGNLLNLSFYGKMSIFNFIYNNLNLF